MSFVPIEIWWVVKLLLYHHSSHINKNFHYFAAMYLSQLESHNHKYFPWKNIVRHFAKAPKRRRKTHWEAEAPNLFIVQWQGNPDTDVGTPLHRRGGDGEVLWIVPSQKHLEHTVHPLPTDRIRRTFQNWNTNTKGALNVKVWWVYFRVSEKKPSTMSLLTRFRQTQLILHLFLLRAKFPFETF